MIKDADMKNIAELTVKRSIANLNPYTNHPVEGMCSRKSELIKFNKGGREGKIFHFDLVDETGEIRCTCFNEVADKFYQGVEKGKTYVLSKITLKCGNPKYTKSAYEITLNKNSILKSIDSDKSFALQTVRYDFCEVDTLFNIELGSVIDFIGYIGKVEELTLIHTKKDDRKLKKKSVYLMDLNKKMIELVLWGDYAEDFQGKKGQVVTLSKVRLTSFNSTFKLNSNNDTSIRLDEDLPLKKCFNEVFDSYVEDANLYSREIKSHVKDLKAIDILKLMKQEEEEEESNTFRLKCTLMSIRHDKKSPLYYRAVTEKNYKVVEENDKVKGTRWYCPHLNNYFDDYNCRYILSMEVADETARIPWLTAFDEVGKFVLGCEAKLIELKRTENIREMNNIIENSFNKRYVITLRIKSESYNDEMRKKLIVCKAEQLNYIEESKKLIESIRLLVK